MGTHNIEILETNLGYIWNDYHPHFASEETKPQKPTCLRTNSKQEVWESHLVFYLQSDLSAWHTTGPCCRQSRSQSMALCTVVMIMGFSVSTDCYQDSNPHLWVMGSGAISLRFLICEMRIIEVPAFVVLFGVSWGNTLASKHTIRTQCTWPSVLYILFATGQSLPV